MAISRPVACIWWTLFTVLSLNRLALGQSPDISQQTSGSSSATATYQRVQTSLAQEWQSLVAQGATPDQINAWRTQNAARLQAQQQLAQTIGAASSAQPLPILTEVSVPSSASPVLRNYLINQAYLANERAQIRNQYLQAVPAVSGAGQAGAALQQAEQDFLQQHTGDLNNQLNTTGTLASEAALQPLPAPPPLVMPPNASPKLKAFLLARNVMAQDWARIRNQYITADPATRQAAFLQWQKQNAAGFQHLIQLTQNLSTPAN